MQQEGKLTYVSNGRQFHRRYSRVLIHGPDGRIWQPEHVPQEVVLIAGDVPRCRRTLDVFLGKAERSASQPSRWNWPSHAISFALGGYFALSVFWYLS